MTNKINNFMIRAGNLVLLFAIPILHGCGGGGGGSASVGGLFTTSSTTGTTTTLASAVTESGAVNSIHNPEPATMLLLGGGMVALGFIRGLRK